MFGVRFGADPQVVLDVIGTSFGGSTMMTRNLPRFISRDFSPATPVGLILKDLGLIHDEAQAPAAFRCCSVVWPNSAFPRRARAASATRTWPRWSSSGRSPPASTSRSLAERCRSTPPTCPCCGPSWTSTTASRPRRTAGFTRVEILFVHTLDVGRIEQAAAHDLGLSSSCSIPRRRLGGRRARAWRATRLRRAEFERTLDEAVQTAQRLRRAAAQRVDRHSNA